MLVYFITDDISNLKEFGTQILDICNNNTVILLGSISNEKPTVFCGITSDLLDKLHAANMVKEIGYMIGGGGGGKPNIATAGGKHPKLLVKAMEFGKNKITEIIG